MPPGIGWVDGWTRANEGFDGWIDVSKTKNNTEREHGRPGYVEPVSRKNAAQGRGLRARNAAITSPLDWGATSAALPPGSEAQMTRQPPDFLFW